MPLGPTLETARLLLRPPEERDFPGFQALMANEATARFIGGVQSPAAAWRGMAMLAGAWALRGMSMWSVVEKASGDWIGRLGPWYPEGWPEPEVGWALLPGAQGKGYALEGAAAAIDYAIDGLGWGRVIHCIDPDNAPSIGLAGRLGSGKLYETMAPPPFETQLWHVYGQDAAAWRANRTGLIKPA